LPTRSCHSYPATLRDTGLWQTVWERVDPLRHWYWRVKNSGQRGDGILLSERAQGVLTHLHRDGIGILGQIVEPADLRVLRHTNWVRFDHDIRPPWLLFDRVAP
jgi:hypothetical protein